MADDDYQYQPKPLPGLKTFGGNQTDVGESPPQSRTIGTTDPTEDPFGNPAGLGSPGGSGSLPAGCDSSGVIGDLNTSNIGFPCVTPRSLITANAVALMDESGNAVELSAVNGRLVITFAGPKTITIAAADLDNGDEAEFREFEICAGQMIKVLSTAPA